MAMKQYTIKIGGMSCEHCVARVTKALESLGETGTPTVSLENGTATVESAQSLDALKNAIEELGFDVLGIE